MMFYSKNNFRFNLHSTLTLIISCSICFFILFIIYNYSFSNDVSANWKLISKGRCENIYWIDNNNILFVREDIKLPVDAIHYDNPKSLFLKNLKEDSELRLFSDDYLPLVGYSWIYGRKEDKIHLFIGNVMHIHGGKFPRSMEDDVRDFKFSPDRKKIALFIINKINMEMQLFGLENKEITTLWSVPIYKNFNGSEIHWNANSNKLLFVINLINNDENIFKIYFSDSDGKKYKYELVTMKNLDYLSSLSISNDGEHICSEENLDNGKKNLIKIYKIKSKKLALIGQKKLTLPVQGWWWSHNDKYLLSSYCMEEYAGTCKLLIYNLDKKLLYEIEPPNKENYYAINYMELKWSPNDNMILLVMNKIGGVGADKEIWLFDFNEYQKKYKGKGKKK